MARLEAGRQAEDRIPPGQCRARRAAATAVLLRAVDRAEIIPEEGRAEVLLVADTLPPGMTVATNRFSPRFTPNLTHRQEASEGASCPPRRVAPGKAISQAVMVATAKDSDLGVE